MQKRIESLAANFAAKEALIKAMGKLFSWKEIEVLRDREGKPYLRLSGKTLKFIKDKGIGNIHLSLSHEGEYAIAFLILEGGL